jgi:hypothetical protein
LVTDPAAFERDEHLPAVDAIRRASLVRFRPIMMTTMAALLGGIPLMLGQGTGSEVRQPLGYAMVGGLIVSQALTPVHDAGDLPLPRQAIRVVRRASIRSDQKALRTRRS